MSKNKDTTDSPYLYEIRTPVAGFSGAHQCGIIFSDGVGRTSDYTVAMRCRTLGYTVTDTATGKAMEPKKEEATAS
jgi:hypothetical protein